MLGLRLAVTPKRLFLVATIIMIVAAFVMLYREDDQGAKMVRHGIVIDASPDDDKTPRRQPRVRPPQNMGTARSAEAEPWQEEHEILGRQECWEACGSPCVPNVAGVIECPAICDGDDECGLDALCSATWANNDGVRIRRCLQDQCAGLGSHDDCGPGMSCRYVGRLEGGIYRCVNAGVRKIDEPCAHQEYKPAGRCERGLHCSYGTCVPDVCIDDEDCGKRSRCYLFAGGEESYQCAPYCESDEECVDGDICYIDEGSSGHCVDPSVLGCKHAGCAEGMDCVVNQDRSFAVITSCMKPCTGKVAGECAADEFCGNSEAELTPYCYQRCEDGDEPCGEGWMCVENTVEDHDGNRPRACVRDIGGAIDVFFREFEAENP